MMADQNEILLSNIDRTKLPKHIAIIMDGNGRWAKTRGFQRIRGHRAGVESIRDVVTFCAEIGIGYLTLYAFSTENWARPKHEVSMLMKLLEQYLIKELPTFQKNNIRFNVIGKIEQLPETVRNLIAENIEATKSHTGLTLTLALNYSGRSELTDAVQRIGHDLARGTFQPDDITEQVIASYLFTADMPDPDLLIRTSGELRVSNFLLWQISYSEIWVTSVLWPDMRRTHIVEALEAFQQRERRYGKVK